MESNKIAIAALLFIILIVGINFAMYATLGSYSARVGVESSDRVFGMGLGTIEAPDFTVHTCFYLTFRWTQR